MTICAKFDGRQARDCTRGVGSPRIEDVPADRIRHVYPTFGREHVTDQRDQCWCGPKVEFADNGAVIIHEVEQ